MSEPSDRRQTGGREPGPADTWERRAAELASEIQRWLIRSSARSMRDELGDQVRKVLKPQEKANVKDPAEVWSMATTEPPDAAEQPPECAWCPVCRAARRIAEARSAAAGNASPLYEAADVMAGAVRDALAGLDSILSYRPGESGAPAQPSPSGASNGTAKEPDDEPGHRG